MTSGKSKYSFGYMEGKIEDRPTLEEQIAVSKLTYEECMELIRPHGLKKVDFFLHQKVRWLWSILHWNWFDVGKL